MTTTSRRKRKPKPPVIMTVETNQQKKRPDVELIPLSKYKEDFKARMSINNHELRELWGDTKWVEGRVRPHVVNFIDELKPRVVKFIDRVKEVAP